MKKINIISFAFFMFMSSCASKKSDTQSDERQAGDRTSQVIHIGNVYASMKFLPGYAEDFFVSSGPEVDTARTGDYYFFSARLDRQSVEMPGREQLLYLDFDMQNDFMLINANDSIPASICQRIENGIAGSYEYVLAFAKPGSRTNHSDLSILYRDKIFGIGTIEFFYPAAEFEMLLK